jgi:tetratricopeptide (TPR) repeat protein
MGWLWYGGTLVPVIGLVQVGNQAMADRYAYLPSVGVLIMVIWGAGELTRHWRHQRRWLFAAGSAALIGFVGLTRLQLGYWRNSEILFRHALAVTEQGTETNGLVRLNLGMVFQQQGRLSEAISQYQTVLRLKPGDARAHYDLGVALGKAAQTDAAISQYEEALRLDPGFAEARVNLGLALVQLGRVDAAISEYQAVLRLQPDNVKAHNNLGIALARKGQWDAAILQFQAVLNLQPENAEAQNNLARVQALKAQAHEPHP